MCVFKNDGGYAACPKPCRESTCSLVHCTLPCPEFQPWTDSVLKSMRPQKKINRSSKTFSVKITIDHNVIKCGNQEAYRLPIVPRHWWGKSGLVHISTPAILSDHHSHDLWIRCERDLNLPWTNVLRYQCRLHPTPVVMSPNQCK